MLMAFAEHADFMSMPLINMPRKVIKTKAVAKTPIGWKKKGKDYVYYFKHTVAKKFNIKRIDFLGFKDQPTGLSLYGTGGGFNMRLSNKIGGSHFLTFLKDKYKQPIKLTIYSNGHGTASFKIQKTGVSISVLFDSFKELLKDLGYEIKDKREAIIQNRLNNFYPKEFKNSEITKATTNAKLNDINFNTLDKKDHEAVGNFIKRYISINAGNDEVLQNLQTDLVIQGRKKTLDQVIKKFEKHIKDKNFDEKNWQKFLHEDVFFFISNYIESIREADVNFGKLEDGMKKPDFVWIDM